MEKTPKKAKKSKKKQPLKVVYITNPIKFNTSASEFRALVQELTGQDAAEDGGGEAVRAAAAEEDNVHAQVEQQVTKLGWYSGEVTERDVDKLSPNVEPFDDSFVDSLMVDGFKEWA